jgi:hypothetical protein
MPDYTNIVDDFIVEYYSVINCFKRAAHKYS